MAKGQKVEGHQVEGFGGLTVGDEVRLKIRGGPMWLDDVEKV